MSPRALARTFVSLLAAVVVAALFALPGTAHARPCHGCDDPGPDDPPTGCPEIAATVEPALVTPKLVHVGDRVQAKTGQWNVNATSIKVYWYAGTAIWNGPHEYASTIERTLTSPFFTPAQLGQEIRMLVVAVGNHPNCTKSEFSEETLPVAVGPAPTVVNPPTLEGEVKVGATVHVDSGWWSRAIDDYTVTWRGQGGSSWEATGKELTLPAELAGQTIAFWVTAKTYGYQDGTYYGGTLDVALGDAPAPATPVVITGTPQLGNTLTLSEAAWTVQPDFVQVQWLRDGRTIVGATGPSYAVRTADLGHDLSANVVASKAGHQSAEFTVQKVRAALAAAPKWEGAKAALKGRNKVGKTVRVALAKAKIRKRAQAPGAKITYQWLRQGKAIKKATTAKHKIVKADRGKVLKVRITVALPGHKQLKVVTKQVRIKNNGKKIG